MSGGNIGSRMRGTTDTVTGLSSERGNGGGLAVGVRLLEFLPNEFVTVKTSGSRWFPRWAGTARLVL